MLSDDQKTTVSLAVNNALDEAENIWNKYGEELAFDEQWNLRKADVRADSFIDSRIPGHQKISELDPKIDQFIAIVADMRDSTRHLMCRIASTKQNVTELKRIYYETSALLPALEMTIQFKNGSVTEYLGDGVLGLFQVDLDDKDRAIYAAYNAAKNCINCARRIVNDALSHRYDLPEIDIGVGLAYSKAIVVAIGIPGQRHAKAMGACIYRATKLSAGTNKIYVDEALRNSWPSSEKGKLKFIAHESRFSDVKGFLVQSG